MEALKALVQGIVVIVLLTTFLDLLLPSSSMKPYIKVVMGLFILVSILSPLLDLLLGNQDFEVFAWQQQQGELGRTLLEDGYRMQAINRELLKENYARRLEGQMKALVKLVEKEGDVEVRVVLKEDFKSGAPEEIERVTVQVKRGEEDLSPVKIVPVEPVRILPENRSSEKELAGLSPPDQDQSAEKRKKSEELKGVLSQYFGLQSRQIEVVFL